jgi:antitoxin ParD1/3/4
MNVSLTKHLEDFVRQKVESGRYNNASEVVREALRSLEQQDRAKEAEMDWLRGEVKKGIDDIEAGRFEAFDIEEIIAEVDAEDVLVKATHNKGTLPKNNAADSA